MGLEALGAGLWPAIAGLTSPARGPLRPLTRPEAHLHTSALCLSHGAPALHAAVRIDIGCAAGRT